MYGRTRHGVTIGLEHANLNYSLLPHPLEEIMPEQVNKPNPNEKLVKVFDSEQETEVMIVKGLLDSAGIDSDMTSVDAVQDLFPGIGGTVLLVREEDASEAERIIETYRNAAIDDETAEISGEPGTKL